MSGSTPENPPDKKPPEVKKKSSMGAWVTPALFIMIAIIILWFSLLIIACVQVGSQCSCVPICSGDMWYNMLIGSF